MYHRYNLYLCLYSCYHNGLELHGHGTVVVELGSMNILKTEKMEVVVIKTSTLFFWIVRAFQISFPETLLKCVIYSFLNAGKSIFFPSPVFKVKMSNKVDCEWVLM